MCHDALKCAVLYCVVDQVVLGIRLLAELIWILNSSCLNPWLAQSWPQSKRAGRSTSSSSRSDSVPTRDKARGGPEWRRNTQDPMKHKDFEPQVKGPPGKRASWGPPGDVGDLGRGRRRPGVGPAGAGAGVHEVMEGPIYRNIRKNTRMRALGWGQSIGTYVIRAPDQNVSRTL